MTVDASIAPSTEAAEALVRCSFPEFGIPRDAELHLVKHRENSVFSCAVSNRNLIVRLHRHGYHSDAALAEEVRFVDELRHQGIPVPEFLRTSGGNSFATVKAHGDPRSYQVDAQIAVAHAGDLGDPPAADPEAVQPDPGDFFQVGLLLAQVHRATEQSGFQIETPRCRWDESGLFGSSATWGDPLSLPALTDAQRSLIARAISKIREQLESYGRPADRYGPIHADASPANLLRTSGGLTLIDFDDFGEGWHMFDLATAIYAFTPHSRYLDYRRELLSGYESLRALTSADREAFEALIIARGLTYLAWAAERRGEAAADAQISLKLPRLMRIVERYLDQPGGVE